MTGKPVCHINPHKISEFLKEPPAPPPKTPRLAYAITHGGNVVWIGRAHRELPSAYHGQVSNYGYLMKGDTPTEDMVAHFPYSTSMEALDVPAHMMEAVEEELRKHGQVNIKRQKGRNAD